MSELPVVVIVGRPNVGKSSIFNRILGRRAAVVSDREGVTRDRHFQVADWNGSYFHIVDTGGFIDRTGEDLDEQVRLQIQAALAEADLAIFLADGLTGITDVDMRFARMVLKSGRKTILAVNKSERRNTQIESHQFWNLGLGNPFAVSALDGSGVADLLDEMVRQLPTIVRSPPDDHTIRVAILGRPNSGKSTLVNALIGENRLVTSAIAGTTRDSIDTEFEYEGHRMVLTDTAGLRKKARVSDEVEYFSNMRALESIRRSHVCILLVDAERGVEEQDLRIATQIEQSGKAMILALNKWDLIPAESKTFDHLVKEIVYNFPDLEWVPILSISGMKGKRLPRLLNEVVLVHQRMAQVFGRERVIEFFNQAIESHPHPGSNQGSIIITRCCQVTTHPPGLALEVARTDLVQPAYLRYLKKQAMDFFDLMGTPLKIYLRKRLELRSDENLQRFVDYNAGNPDY